MAGKHGTEHMGQCERCRADHPYSPVVIVGNGPSAMCLSYFLSGRWPYYNGLGHPNEYLHDRLKDNTEKSLIEQDLQYLSSGLEGRSRHPVALLFDTLQHPNADQGDRVPSRMEFKHHQDKTIPHVVLGSGLPGGAWWDLDASVLTLSLGCWMELPGQDFKDWIANFRSKNESHSPLSVNQMDRATLGEVARYYQSYVKEKNLEKYFLSHTLVTSVQRLEGKRIVNSESGERETTCKKCFGLEGENLFEVKGIHRNVSCDCCKTFSILTKNVVVATGMLGRPNKLGVEGEDLNFVKGKVQDLEAAIQGGDLGCACSRVIVVGAGLSAADAVQCCRNANIPVVHIFRRKASDPQIALARLPKAVYPEYHEILELMKGIKKDDKYTPLAEHVVEKFQSDHKVTVTGPQGSHTLQVSMAAVLIGSQPNLSFLPKEGRCMGFHKDQPISYKTNPLAVNPFTMEVIDEPGLFAMGPLVGDNFVRFSLGGALAITQHLVSKGLVDKQTKNIESVASC